VKRRSKPDPRTVSLPLEAQATWAQSLRLKSRYQRSVHLERDAQLADTWLEGYVVSPMARSLIERIGRGIRERGGTRAWSITGPYGTGKSSFALFATELFGPPDAPVTQHAGRALASADRALGKSLAANPVPGLWPVRAVGERRALDAILVAALKRAVDEFWSGRGTKPAIHAEVVEAHEKTQKGKRLHPSAVVSLFERVAEKIGSSNRSGAGLFVVLDEAGKVLEFAAQNADDGDVYLLQALAEAASRSDAHPLCFVVVLHQGFDQYASRLSATQRNEWAKVQGRFEDVAFQEATDQLVRLVGDALGLVDLPENWRQGLHRSAAASVGAMRSVDAARREALTAALVRCAPLHPITALLLGPLFRTGIGQNERSLFAFLVSNEPAALQEFASSTTVFSDALPRLFTLDRIYDYFRSALGNSLYGANARHWAQLETALSRLPEDAPELHARLLKAIVVFAVSGEAAGLRPSPDALVAALEDASTPRRSIEEALRRLRDGSFIVYRKVRDSFQLWDGSDLDLDALIATGLGQSTSAGALPRRLASIAPPRPLIPRRHAIDTGTLRYFEVRYADEGALDAALEADAEADGTVLLFVPSSEQAERDVEARLSQPLFWVNASRGKASRPLVMAIPSQNATIRRLALELAAMEWVQTNTPELRDDEVARRELTGRIVDIEAALRTEVSAVLAGAAKARWYFDSTPLVIESARALSRRLSDALGTAYAEAPHIHNELINRTDLSSSAAGARRTLLEAMIERGGIARLGIDGSPPELAMYRSLLEVQGIHREIDGAWRFAEPIEGTGSLRAAWSELRRLLASAERRRVGLSSIFEHLERPPFGVRRGVLPVLVIAQLLAYPDELALYEENMFVSSLTPAVAERIVRAAPKFELQRVPMSAARLDVLRALAGPDFGDGPALLPVVRSLVRTVARLPDHSRNTRRVSASAVAVRESLLRAKEPGVLLFTLLPEACGLSAFGPDAAPDSKATEMFVHTLKSSLRELTGAYPRLLRDLTAALGRAFGLPGDLVMVRASLRPRAASLLGLPVEPGLKSFLIRLADTELGDDEWVVSVATLLGGKPPESWHDGDFDHAIVKLSALRRAFNTVEALHLASRAQPLSDDGLLLRLAIAEPGKPEVERVVAVRPEQVGALQALVKALRRTLRAGDALTPELIAAGLAQVARETLLATSDDGEAAPQPSAKEFV
jgi:hypothetical protein